jgi:hypothetical protein
MEGLNADGLPTGDGGGKAIDKVAMECGGKRSATPLSRAAAIP